MRWNSCDVSFFTRGFIKIQRLALLPNRNRSQALARDGAGSPSKRRKA